MRRHCKHFLNRRDPLKPTSQRVIIKGVIVRDGKLLMVQRKREGHAAHGLWELPGGKVEFGERLEIACVREVFEETGVRVIPSRIDIEHYQNAFFEDKERGHIILIPVFCTYISTDETQQQDKNVLDIRWVPLHVVRRLPLLEGTLGLIEHLIMHDEQEK